MKPAGSLTHACTKYPLCEVATCGMDM